MTLTSPTFYHLNKTVHVLNILAGMPLPNQRIAYKLYCLMTEVVLMLGFVTATDAFLNSDHVMDRFKSTAIGSASLIGLFNSIYQKQNYKRSQKALQNLDKVSVDFRRDLFGEHFDHMVIKEFRIEHMMLSIGAFVTALSALVYPYWSEFIPVDERTERKLATPMRMPYMGEYATAYWPLSFILCLAILYGNLKIIAAHCFYMSTLSQIKCCFMQLKNSLRYIIENEETTNHLKIWIQRHQDIQRVGNEFCNIYSPMFSIFLAYFVIVNTSIMVMSMSVSDLDLIMKISALSHVCMCAVLLYLSCNTGSCLEHESFTVGQEAYGSSWYTKQLSVKKYFQIIIMRSNHKVMCKCMLYPSITLSNETYAKNRKVNVIHKVVEMVLTRGTFYRLNKTAKVINTLAGMPVPGHHLSYTFYSYITDAILLFGLLTTSCSLLNSDDVMDKFSTNAILAVCVIGLTNSVYQKFNYSSSTRILDELDNISADFKRAMVDEDFDFLIQKNIRLYNKLLSMGAFITALSAVVFPFWRDFIPQDERTKKELASHLKLPFVDYNDSQYWPLSCLLCFIILIGNFKIIAPHCYYIGTLSQVKCGLTYLKHNLFDLIEFTEDPSEDLMKIWVQRHQNILRVGQDLCKMYSPLFSFFLAFFVIMNASVMILITSMPDLDFMMKMSALSHICMCLTTLFLSCNIGSCLEHESFIIAEESYGSSWYTKNVYKKQSMCLILLRSNHQISCKCIFIPSLSLNNETYAKFFRFSLSTLLSIRKIVALRMMRN